MGQGPIEKESVSLQLVSVTILLRTSSISLKERNVTITRFDKTAHDSWDYLIS